MLEQPVDSKITLKYVKRGKCCMSDWFPFYHCKQLVHTSLCSRIYSLIGEPPGIFQCRVCGLCVLRPFSRNSFGLHRIFAVGPQIFSWYFPNALLFKYVQRYSITIVKCLCLPKPISVVLYQRYECLSNALNGNVSDD